MNGSAVSGPMKCKAKKRDGTHCKAWAMKGSTVCRVHGGRAPQVKAAAKRRLALGELENERLRLGVPVKVGNAEALVEMVWEAAGNVAFYRGLVQQLRTGEALVKGYDDEDILEAMANIGVGKPVPSRKGQIADRVDPSNWRAEPHVLVRMYNEERDRLVKYAKLCRDAGIEEHRIALAESQGQMLFDAVRSFLAALTASLISAVPTYQAVVKRVMSTEAPSMLAASLRVLDDPL